MRIVRTDSFKRDFQDLPQRIKRSTEKALRLLVVNLRHHSLRAKKMEGQRDAQGLDIWEARVTKAYRLTFVVEGDMYLLRRAGPHEDTLRNP